MYKRKQRSELDSWIFLKKVHDHVCKHAIQRRISLKHLPTERCIGLLRHAYQQNMSVSDETSLISREVECMGLVLE